MVVDTLTNLLIVDIIRIDTYLIASYSPYYPKKYHKEVRILEQTREIAYWIARQTGIEVEGTENNRFCLNINQLFTDVDALIDGVEALAEQLIDGLREEFDAEFDYAVSCGQLTIKFLG